MQGKTGVRADAVYLRSRVDELEGELQRRMDDVIRLDRELRHARADGVVKDEYLAVLDAEAHKLQRIRELVAKVPFGSWLVRSFDGRPRHPDQELLAERVRVTYKMTLRRTRARAGRIKRLVLGVGEPDH